MASKKTRAKRRQERMQQLQRNAAIPPAQVSMEDLTPKAEGIAAEETAEPDVHRTFPTDMRESILAKEVEQRIECVPLERIVTEQYQRILNMKNVAGIVKNFDPAKLGVLVVSHRADGTYAVLDGQHRLTALRRLGYDAANCIVLEGMTIRQEADYFRRQNENKQSPHQRHVQRLAVGGGCGEPAHQGTHGQVRLPARQVRPADVHLRHRGAAAHPAQVWGQDAGTDAGVHRGDMAA